VLKTIGRLVGILILFGSGFCQAKLLDKADNKQLSVAVRFFSKPIDPHFSNHASLNKIARQLFDTLVNFDSSSHPMPGIASHWDIDYARNKITVYIRPDAKFHNGKPIVCADILFSLIRSTNNGNFLINQMRDIDQCLKIGSCSGFQVSNDKVCSFTLQNGNFSLFLKKLASMQASIITLDHGKIIGSGPFKIEKETDLSIETTRIRDINQTNIQKIIFRKYTVPISIEEFAEKRLDELDSLDANLVGIKAPEGTTVVEFPAPNTYVMELNLRKGPFAHREIREALSLAFEPETFLTDTNTNGKPADSFIPPGLFGYAPKKAVNDEIKAKVLVKKRFGNRPMKIRIGFFNKYSDNYLRALVGWVEKIGAQPVIIKATFDDLLKKMRNNEIDCMIRFHTTQNYDVGSIFEAFESGSHSNISGFRSKKFDKILIEYESIIDADLKKRHLKLMQDFLDEEKPFIKMYYPIQTIWYAKKINIQNPVDLGLRFWEFPYREFSLRE